MERKSCKFLCDIVKSAEAIETAIRDRTPDDYIQDLYLRLAIERLFEIIGEALNQMSRIDPETTSSITDYRSIIGLRNVLIHGYARIDNDRVWTIATQRLPLLLREARDLLKKCEES